ncbi:MAG: EspF repeat-containing protein [Oscillospiraceae bacterium]
MTLIPTPEWTAPPTPLSSSSMRPTPAVATRSRHL